MPSLLFKQECGPSTPGQYNESFSQQVLGWRFGALPEQGAYGSDSSTAVQHPEHSWHLDGLSGHATHPALCTVKYARALLLGDIGLRGNLPRCRNSPRRAEETRLGIRPPQVRDSAVQGWPTDYYVYR